MALARVHSFSISLDGFGTGEGQSHDAPFGHAGERLHEWMFAAVLARDGRPARRQRQHRRRLRPAARSGDRRRDHGCREVRPARMARGPAVEGLVGSQPLRSTHRPSSSLSPRPSIEMEGGTTFPLHRRLACRGAQDRPRGRRRPGRTHRRESHHDPRLPCCRDHRPPAHRGRPDLARPRRTPLGRDWRASRRTTRSRPPPHPAESHA